ncbi:(2Fe-2S)-binding protein [Streptomyces boncukensis]|uniref:(2Fe-2S)-binding protein n=1 Tax=Streptomyces boncukensis TaxID=2711219 RepID=A0A6G4X2Q0_9ACTN|nr:(2Fe-2S)-binding protein [Streptomyces boncukensis]NGO70941.1 (2Fe-2S)-binding protein [Streptomyces boncukensis]
MSGTTHGNENANRNANGNTNGNGNANGVPEQYDDPYGAYGQERPQAWGTGEYDADATGFVQLPSEGLPPDFPLAAPGTGQGGYTPPPIEPAPPAHPEPAADAPVPPPAGGHWVLPFAGAEAGTPQRHPGEAEFTGPEPEPHPEPGPPAGAEEPGAGAPYGQGAAAALAGSHEARTRRRPLGDGTARPVSGGPEGAHSAVPDAPPEAVPEHAPTPAGLTAPEPAPPSAPEPSDPRVSDSATSDSATSDSAVSDSAVSGSEAEQAAAAVPEGLPVDGEHPLTSYVLHVNGADRPVTGAWIGESLLYVLRERLGLAGAKDGCSQGECGACSVQVDGRLVAACLVPAATTAGSEIRTVEGLAAGGAPSDVQRALIESGAVQCGFCVPGLAMTVHDLLEGNHAPSELETRQAVSGNLCRCSGYRGVLDAVRAVAAERAATPEPEGETAPEGPQIPQQARHPEWGGG